jgi:serine O-acetyltransferase
MTMNARPMLLEETRSFLEGDPALRALVPSEVRQAQTDAELLAGVLAAGAGSDWGRTGVYTIGREVLAGDPDALEAAVEDVIATAERNMEPGGMTASLLFARGVHALIGHRVVHGLWRAGRTGPALALKTVLGRAFSTDIHPAARFGRRIFLDHGLGFVVGETAVIEDDVSIWHGVTLGSTLKQEGDRHPKIRAGAVIGADAIILGNVEVGEQAFVAAGAIVLQDVPPRTTVAGVPARERQRSAGSFKGFT